MLITQLTHVVTLQFKAVYHCTTQQRVTSVAPLDAKSQRCAHETVALHAGGSSQRVLAYSYISHFCARWVPYEAQSKGEGSSCAPIFHLLEPRQDVSCSLHSKTEISVSHQLLEELLTGTFCEWRATHSKVRSAPGSFWGSGRVFQSVLHRGEDLLQRQEGADMTPVWLALYLQLSQQWQESNLLSCTHVFICPSAAVWAHSLKSQRKDSCEQVIQIVLFVTDKQYFLISN